MQIYYVHHAIRDKGNPPTQADDITELGRQDAILSGKILSERIKSRNAIHLVEHAENLGLGAREYEIIEI